MTDSNGLELSSAVALLVALSDPTRGDHHAGLSALESAVSNPIFVQTIAHLFAHGGANKDGTPSPAQALGLTVELRQLSGLVLKNFCLLPSRFVTFDPTLQATLKGQLMTMLADPLTPMRHTAASLIGFLAEKFDSTLWVDLIQPLVSHLVIETAMNPNGAEFLDGIALAIQRVCEDASVKLAIGIEGHGVPLEGVLNSVLTLLERSNEVRDVTVNIDNTPSSLANILRVRAMSALNCLLALLEEPATDDTWVDMTGATSDSAVGLAYSAGLKLSTAPLVCSIQRVMTVLAGLSSDPNPDVRRAVCQALSTIALLSCSLLSPNWDSVCGFMLTALADTTEAVALEACEYWQNLLANRVTHSSLTSFVPMLVDVLLSRLVLTQEQLEYERRVEEEENAGQKALNIKPIHHRAGGNRNSDEDGSSGDSDELSRRQTIRKQAAFLLDTLSMTFRAEMVLPHALPAIQSRMASDDIFQREAGVLALGTLSRGCMDAMTMYLPQFHTFLETHVTHELPEMRAIACWVLSRYAPLFPTMYEEEGDGTSLASESTSVHLYVRTLQVLSKAVFDREAKVQVAACTALCVTVNCAFYANNGEGMTSVILPYLKDLCVALSSAFDGLGVKSTLILIDTVGALADVVGEPLADPARMELLLPKVLNLFNGLDEADTRLFPVMECLSSIIGLFGMLAANVLPGLYTRCVTLLRRSIVPPSLAADEFDPDDYLSADMAVCALDLITAIAEGTGERMVELMNGCGGSAVLVDLIIAGLFDREVAEVRQSALSITGELVKNCFTQCFDANKLSVLLDRCLKLTDVEHPLVCTNAVWVLGELIMVLDEATLRPVQARIQHVLIEAFHARNLDEGLRVNLAVTFGRLAMKFSFEVASVADEVFTEWCHAMQAQCPSDERAHAFRGLLAVLRLNPDVIKGQKEALNSLMHALIVWQEPPPEDITTGVRELLEWLGQQNATLFKRSAMAATTPHGQDMFLLIYGISVSSP